MKGCKEVPTESQEIGSDNKKQKNIKDFRKEIISKITSAKIERKYCKQLIMMTLLYFLIV
ncbi:hypothetical protein [Spiroplasma endosymbiont of Notiophilus biguttatus]|uniref:hypothetical protein n=1 Tax=Spiroplasma endosymbiont of Notiophilus biguttatus TaxID=3066285 RepID=UPI00313B6E92